MTTGVGALATTGAVACAGAGAAICTGAASTAATGAGVGAGVARTGVAGFGGDARRTRTGRGGAAIFRAGRATPGGTTPTLGATALVGAPGRGSGRARTIAGCAARGGSANVGVWTPPGPATNRGNAAAPTTAPASSRATKTPLVIALMLPTTNADNLTRKGYRHVETRA